MKRIAILLLFPVYMTNFYGQEDAALNRAINNIANQLEIFPQEKIYLHTDKPYYITGEKIFFRAFLLDAFSNNTEYECLVTYRIYPPRPTASHPSDLLHLTPATLYNFGLRSTASPPRNLAVDRGSTLR